MRRRVSLAQAGVLLVLGVMSSLAWGGIFEKDKDPEEKPWEEASFDLPAAPVDAGLIAFKVGVRTDMKFQIDGPSISIGNDGVIRYTLVVTGSQGGRNVSYEGMRCETAERRSYAFGRGDGSWSPSRSDRWVRIRGDSNNHYVELFANYFCAIGAPTLTTPESARLRLRQGGTGVL